jgi:ATP-dependent Lhr-like helicase
VSGPEGVADLLRLLGPLTVAEIAARCEPGDPVAWTEELRLARRAVDVSFGGASWVVAVEDVARLRDALGVPVPQGVPDAFIDPVADPLGDLVSRFARTHGPFAAASVAERFGLGTAVVTDALRRLAGQGRVAEGEFRPGGSGSEWCDAEVLRRLRRRSLAALRSEVEPVEPQALGRFLPAWQQVGSNLRGVDGVLTVIEQLAGCTVPASALEPLVLAARVRDYSPTLLDELTASGEVLWSGAGTLPGTDGWVGLHLADTAPLTLADADEPEGDLQQRVVQALSSGGAYFFRQLSDAVASTDDKALHEALWSLVWAGHLTNDTLAALRTLTGSGSGAHRSRRSTPRRRVGRPRLGQPALPSRTGPLTAAGRWSLLPPREGDPTKRAYAAAELLLDRHGVVTRGSAVSERVPGGFAAAYKVLSGFEETGRARRGYFVAGLGAAQFSTSGAVDRLRSFSAEPDSRPRSLGVTLAATDPANPYGAALAWPRRADADDGTRGHRPGRKAGALVVLVDGALVIYVERGGRTLLTFDDEAALLEPAVASLAQAVRGGALGKLAVERADGEHIMGTTLADALEAAGFHATPRGLRLRS